MSHHKPPSKPITTNRLHHTGTAAVMIHSHRDDDDDRMQPVVQLQRNVIARLMGIDAAAVVPRPPAAAAATKPGSGGNVQFQAQRGGQTNKRSLQQLPYYDSYRGGNHHHDDDDDDAEHSGPSSRLCLNTMMTMRVPRSGWRRRRRHPQEEELLQKMRQDLQAWQASKAPAALQQTSSSPCTKPSDSDSGSRSLVLQAIAQEDLRKQKMARYGLDFSLGGRHSKVPPPPTATATDEMSLDKTTKKNGSVAQCEGDSSSSELVERAAAAEPVAPPRDSVAVAAAEVAPAEEESGDSVEARQDGHGRGASGAQDLPSNSTHTTIVLLKPATTCSQSDTATGGVAIGGALKTSFLLDLPKLHRDADMRALVQEVKDRIQREVRLTAATATGRGDPIKTPALAWAIPPLQQVTKQDRGNKTLFRSESFRAFRTDRKRNASAPPATTRHDAASLKAAADILKGETALSPENKVDEELMTDASLSVLPCVGVADGQSFRSECLTTKHRDDASPRLLFRSFSAPEPGSFLSLGRFFSFKQHEHEASEPPPATAVTVTSKSVVSAAGFSSFIRGTVSSLRRHGFSSRRNLLMFRSKTHWSNKTSLGAGEIHPAKIEMEMPVCAATPTSHETFNLFKVAQASLSELPPSPVSPLEVAGHSSRHFLGDLHFTLPELSPKCLSEFEAPAATSESSFRFRTDITAVEAACSRDKAYITELLIAAGLYHDDGDDDGPSAANARVDSMARPMPICDDVFEDVEDMYYYRGDYIGGGGMCDGTDHRMLFDLANEALQSLVAAESSRGGGASSQSLRQWVVDSTGVSRGKKLVHDVWQQMQALRMLPQPQAQAQEMQTIDGMVACEVRRSVWAEVLYEDVYVVGSKIERAIFDELIEDLFCMR